VNERLAMKIVSAVVGLALVGAAVYLVTIDRSDHVSTLLALGFVALGLAGVVLPSPLPTRSKPRKPPPLPLLALVIAVLVTGCTDPISDQARAATISAGALSAGGDAVMAARAAALDRVEAAHPTDPEHDEQLDLEAARWAPVLEALDTARTALLTWIDSLELARLAGGGGDLLAPIATVAARAVQLVVRAFELAGALGVEDLPAIPPIVRGLVDGFAGR
jgi:hypothetical protein